MTELFSLAGKVALVTGGAQGLGRMIAQGLIDAGASAECLEAYRVNVLAPFAAGDRG